MATPITERIHPTLREAFIPLPTDDTPLTDEQLCAIFSGDLSALKDVARLVVALPTEANSDE